MFIIRETFQASRLVITMLMLMFLRLVNIAPNEGQESDPGDKVAEGGKVANKTKRDILFILVECFFTLYHLYYYGAIELAYHEWALFMLTGYLWFIRMQCYYILGKFFTFTIMVKKDHQLIEDGPYQYLIHPSYTGQVGVIILFITYMLGFDLGFMWLVGLALIAMVIMLLMKRMKIEEEHMTAELGDRYKNYIANKNRLIPFIY